METENRVLIGINFDTIFFQQRAGQQPMQGMANMQGIRGGPGGQQQAMAGNLPPGAMNSNAMGVSNVIRPQQTNASAQMQNNMVNQMNQMGGQMPMSVQGGQINSNINNMMTMNMNQAMAPNQMSANNNQPMNPNQMSQLINRINVPPNMTARQTGTIGGHAPQMINQMAKNSPANLPNAQQANLMPNQQLPGNINQPTRPANPVAGPGQINLSQMLNMGGNQAPNVYQGLIPASHASFVWEVLMK